MAQQLTGKSPGRNDPCPCQSELKYKHCHGDPVKIDIPREITTIINDYAPAYTIVSLSGTEIVKGKTAALLKRKKPRDYYDMYFFLRHPQLHEFVEKTRLKEVLRNLEKERINFKQELSVLLPTSHRMILKDFRSNLVREIKKFII